MNKDARLHLNDSNQIPIMGIGTWDMRGEECVNALLSAFRIGYRHIDTASYYGNEREVGEAIRKSGRDRDEFFVTTKIWPNQLAGRLPRKHSRKALNVWTLITLIFI
ncbi:MAG: aldo/keto reductase [Methanobacteriota archaeon]|nr:MAG: aldo/keto reductase [Euryarchaeota archaeon]